MCKTMHTKSNYFKTTTDLSSGSIGNFANSFPLDVTRHVDLVVLRFLGHVFDVVSCPQLNVEVDEPVRHQVMNGVKTFLTHKVCAIVVELEVFCFVVKTVVKK